MGAVGVSVADVDMEQLISIYGPFADVTPAAARDLLDGFDPWWIGGGWAIEAYTGIERPHEDIDVCVFVSDAARLISHFEGSHHVWAVGSGALKPMTRPDDPIPEWAGQFWIRENAESPWLLDILLTPGSGATWVFKRDESISMPLDQATWSGSDGIRYERADIALLFKAKHDRPKDRADLENVLPLLDDEGSTWLRETLARVSPDHPWLARIS